MINHNMEIVKGLNNIFDYSEYVAKCTEQEIEVRNMKQWSTGVGILKAGLVKFGDKDWQESYTKMFKLINEDTVQSNQQTFEPALERSMDEPEKKSCCGGGKQSPSMIKKIKNYALTMKRWYKAGRPIVSMETLAKRLSICAKCDSLIKDRECSECGCPMIVKAEMDIDKLCELNKW